MTILTAETFDDFIRSNHIVFVDFWAPWCGSCKGFAKILERVESMQSVEYNKPKVEFAKVDVGDAPDIADRYSITSLPTVVLFSESQPVMKEVGAMPQQRIEAILRGLV
ncbi:thiol reductase thioredoxin [Spirochaetia bacterium]|nr:thiol reductase thioredoxin [Spirochaetia bacterium]